ncbi:MAG: rRNA pseudouridine synthase [Ruminococcaceae bacterium]|nr:rRNA pseudouridine synthase [Oscillospiraceae bacterium]
MNERLQKLISAAGIASRRRAEELLRAGRVRVNGAVAGLGQSADPDTDTITVDGRPIRIPTEKVYLMLHKPRGYVTTLSDEKGRPDVSLLLRGAPARVYPVGRLDMDSEGLLLLTNDGALANALMHPSGEIKKVYHATVRGDTALALPRLRAPITLDDGCTVQADAVDALGDDTLQITIHEGRNRQIRRMCAAVGLHVSRLVRVSEGPLLLGDLPAGTWRALTENEISELQSAIKAQESPRDT